MRQFRRLARWLAPGWVLLWLAASLNLLSLCCVDEVQATGHAAMSVAHGHDDAGHAHGHADFPSEQPCTVTLTDRDVPLVPGEGTPSKADDESAPLLPAGEGRLQHRTPRPLRLALHGPPPDRRQTYLHTLRLRI